MYVTMATIKLNRYPSFSQRIKLPSNQQRIQNQSYLFLGNFALQWYERREDKFLRTIIINIYTQKIYLHFFKVGTHLWPLSVHVLR